MPFQSFSHLFIYNCFELFCIVQVAQIDDLQREQACQSEDWLGHSDLKCSSAKQRCWGTQAGQLVDNWLQDSLVPGNGAPDSQRAALHGKYIAGEGQFVELLLSNDR